MMRAFIKSIAVSAALCSIVSVAAAQTTVAGATLFQDVRIFDGTMNVILSPSDAPQRKRRVSSLVADVPLCQ